jgi:hypothetical protein
MRAVEGALQPYQSWWTEGQGRSVVQVFVQDFVVETPSRTKSRNKKQMPQTLSRSGIR